MSLPDGADYWWDDFKGQTKYENYHWSYVAFSFAREVMKQKMRRY